MDGDASRVDQFEREAPRGGVFHFEAGEHAGLVGAGRIRLTATQATGHEIAGQSAVASLAGSEIQRLRLRREFEAVGRRTEAYLTGDNGFDENETAAEAAGRAGLHGLRIGDEANAFRHGARFEDQAELLGVIECVRDTAERRVEGDVALLDAEGGAGVGIGVGVEEELRGAVDVQTVDAALSVGAVEGLFGAGTLAEDVPDFAVAFHRAIDPLHDVIGGSEAIAGPVDPAIADFQREVGLGG